MAPNTTQLYNYGLSQYNQGTVKKNLELVADPEGVQGVRSNPLPNRAAASLPRFLISYENEIIWSQ